MEIKAELKKPYTEQERLNFIVEHQYNYEIEKADNALLAWGYTDEEREEQNRELLNLKSLTKREVFLALYRAKGITPEQVRGSITDPEALIEFDYANEYFRGNPLIDAIGNLLGYSPEHLDYLFINKELPTLEEEPEEEPIEEPATDTEPEDESNEDVTFHERESDENEEPETIDNNEESEVEDEHIQED